MNLRIIDESKIDPNQYYGQDTLAPAKTWYVLSSFAIALILNFIPLQTLVLTIRPDFAALAILFWSINQPQRLGMTIAFCMGLMMDVHNASLLGHHALVYCMVTYVASFFRRRLTLFSLAQQAPQIGLILIFMQGLLVLIALLIGSSFPGWHFFLAALSGALAWPMLSFALGTPLKLKRDNDAL